MALEAIDTHATPDTDPYERAAARALMVGYTARWGDARDPSLVRGVEQRWAAPLIDPVSGIAHPAVELRGKFDVLLRDGFVEHKTTSSDITPGSDYWQRVSALDSQVSMYGMAARHVGADGVCVYDVIRKPMIEPARATPIEARKYTKEKVDKAGNIVEPSRLYAAQREHDESPEDYESRLLSDIESKPDAYYQRAEVVRLDKEREEHALDVWHTVRAMTETHRARYYPRNTDSCFRFKRPCSYFEVCSGRASLDDDTLFRTAKSAHEELENET